jgi:nicotinamide riboside kinase
VRVAILGAEGTGKTCIANALAVLHPDICFEDHPPLRISTLAPAGYDLILLMGTDLPLQQSVESVENLESRKQVDLSLRRALDDQGISYSVIYGTGEARTRQAHNAIAALKGTGGENTHQTTDWKWECDRCSDAACEHRLFSRLLKTSSVQI